MTPAEKRISKNLAELGTPALPLMLDTATGFEWGDRALRSIWSQDMSSLNVELINKGKVVVGFCILPHAVKALAYALMLRTQEYEAEKGELTYETKTT